MIDISSEARKLLREFFEYADELRYKGIYDVTEIASGFYRTELKEYLAENGNKSSLFLKRFVKVAKEFVDNDPRYQSRLDEFAKVSS